MEKDELLAIEYQKAQDSAEHHDSLLWNVTSIMWAGNFVLLGFIINCIKDNDRNCNLQTILLLVCVLGIALVCCVWRFAFIFSSVMNKKYDRCKEIEKELKHITQHGNLEYPKGSQRILYNFVNLLFIIVWIIIFKLV